MKTINRIIAVLSLTLFSLVGHAKKIETLDRISGSALTSTTNILTLQDDNYACLVASSCSPAIDIYKSRFYVKLSYAETNKDHYNSSWNLNVFYTIRLYDITGSVVNTVTPATPLTVNYNPTAGFSYTDIDYDLYDSQNYLRAEIDVISTPNTLPSGIASDIHLDLVYESEQYEAMNVTHAPILNTLSSNTAKAELTLSWPNIQGAESYDVEWLFIDMGKNSETVGTFSYEYDFRNASRINTSATNYTISMAYPRGFLLFRTRAVQDKNTALGPVRIEGNWTTPVNKGTISSASSPFYQYPQTTSLPVCASCSPYLSNRTAYYYAGLEQTKNWQYSVTYAEQGKRKEAITYFDGTLRNRQQVTVSSTDDRAIVGETIYDYVGRPAVNTLPSPQSVNKGMNFYANQNKSSITSGLYNYEDFDTDGNFENPKIIDTGNSFGGANYYSQSNFGLFGINKQYIPTAKGYAYTRVQYKNDGTNRVKKQSGVGETFRMGGGKETKYIYGKPTQEELDRLFGNEAGYANMYKKNAVVDPNGQASISYIDNYGRTIATALSGDIPLDEYEDGRERLLPIDTRPTDFEIITTNLSLSNRLDNKGRMVVSHVFSITAPTTVKFNYTLSGNSLSNLCIGTKDCYFDYEIYITNEYGDKVAFSNGDFIKSAIGVTSASVLNFTTSSLDIGSYQIHKILSLSSSHLSDYIQELSDSNACLDIAIDSVTTCNPPCAEACWSGYVSVDANGDSTFLNDNGDLVAIINSSGTIVTRGALFASGTDAEDTVHAIRLRVYDCIGNCEANIYPDLSPCDIKYNVLKTDMSPGGQYFESLGASSVSNGWLIDNIGNVPPGCISGTWDDARNYWQDSWGDILVKFHPEWCAYQTECCPALSEDDCYSVTIISQSTEGICDPTFVDSEIATEMTDYLGTGHSVTDLFGDTTYPTVYTMGSNTSLDTLLNLLYNTTDGVISVQKIMTPTQFINSIRDFYRELVKYNYIKTNCSSLYLSDANGKTADGFYVRYPKKLLFETFTTPPYSAATGSGMHTLVAASCSTQAERATDQFMAAFACKSELGTDTVTLRNTVLQAMYINCANGDPVNQGLNGVATGFLISKGQPIGCLTGSWLEDEDEQCKCENLFTFLMDANNESLHEVSSNPGSATSTLAINALTNILSATDITNGVSVGDLATWHSNCNTSPYSIGTSAIPEYFTCTNDSVPVDTNACVTAINELSYRNELARVRNQVLDSITAYRNRYTNKCFENIESREVFTMEYLLQEYHYTLYYYDQAGNLIKTVPPEGVYQIDKGGNVVQNSIFGSASCIAVDNHRRNPSATTSFLRPEHIMATNYRYNSLNQLTSQFTPDGDSSHFFYDALGRLVASQNAEQLLRNAYSYTRFDRLGRMIEVGEINNATVTLTEADARDENDYLNQTTSTANLFHMWINNNITNRHQIVNTYYDNQTILPTTVIDQINLRNRIASVTYDKNGDNAYESASHYTYDINGNVNSLIQENKASSLVTYTEQYKQIDYKYDLVSGNVNKVSYQAGEKDEFYHKYEYDADNRLTVAYTSRNDVIWEQESKNLYYAHGPLARTEIGDRQVQAQDYAYTLQGWLKTINSSMGHQDRDIGQDGVAGNINENFGRDAYGFSLHYYRGDYQAINSSSTVASAIAQYGGGDFNKNAVDLYNGNISAMVVGLTKHDNSRAQVMANIYRYDQLNRIKEYIPFLPQDPKHDVIYEENNLNPSLNINQRYNSSYTYDGNGNIELLTRNGSKFIQDPMVPQDPNALIGVPLEMDDFNYEYLNKNSNGAKTNNQLDYVADVIDENNYTDDLDNQDPNNYEYDKIGRLVKDVKEKIDLIVWNVANKITKIEKDGGNQIIEFDYDPMGNRISKKNTIPAGISTTFYVRDAQGNVMTTYQESDITGDVIYDLNDFHIYGSSRLGTKHENKTFFTNGTATASIDRSFRKLGQKRYELSNHLGNLLEVISDRKLSNDNGSAKTEFFSADVVSYSDYYPFGMLMPNRHGQDDDYRYGFNGMESDDEVRNGKGTSYNFGARMLDPRIGRWLSTDKFEHETPSWTPYRFAFNNPLTWIDPDGNREFPSYDAYTEYQKKNNLEVLTHAEMWNQGHWTRRDRGGQVISNGGGMAMQNQMTDIFKKAAAINTAFGRSDQYVNLPERQAYYKWANEFFTSKGFEVKWMAAAESTVGTLQLAQSNGAVMFGFSNAEIVKFISDGNKLILDDMMPRVNDLIAIQAKNGPLKGNDALKWDAQTLSDEQNLIQSSYENLSPESIQLLQENLETSYGFKGKVLNAADRWVLGMEQMGYTGVTADMMPKAGGDYKDVKLQFKETETEEE